MLRKEFTQIYISAMLRALLNFGARRNIASSLSQFVHPLFLLALKCREYLGHSEQLNVSFLL